MQKKNSWPDSLIIPQNLRIVNVSGNWEQNIIIKTGPSLMAIYNIELDTKPPFGNTLLLLLYIQFVPFINNRNTMMMREDRLSSFHFIHLKQMQPSTIKSSTSIDKHRQANYFIFSLPYKKTNLTTTTTKKPAVMQAHIKLYIAIIIKIGIGSVAS